MSVIGQVNAGYHLITFLWNPDALLLVKTWVVSSGTNRQPRYAVLTPLMTRRMLHGGLKLITSQTAPSFSLHCLENRVAYFRCAPMKAELKLVLLHAALVDVRREIHPLHVRQSLFDRLPYRRRRFAQAYVAE